MITERWRNISLKATYQMLHFSVVLSYLYTWFIKNLTKEKQGRKWTWNGKGKETKHGIGPHVEALSSSSDSSGFKLHWWTYFTSKGEIYFSIPLPICHWIQDTLGGQKLPRNSGSLHVWAKWSNLKKLQYELLGLKYRENRGWTYKNELGRIQVLTASSTTERGSTLWQHLLKRCFLTCNT